MGFEVEFQTSCDEENVVANSHDFLSQFSVVGEELCSIGIIDLQDVIFKGTSRDVMKRLRKDTEARNVLKFTLY